MKIEDIIKESPQGNPVDSIIKDVVLAVRQNIRSFGGAMIDGQASVINVKGRQVARQLGTNLEELLSKETNSTWIQKNGRDVYSLGYKK